MAVPQPRHCVAVLSVVALVSACTIRPVAPDPAGAGACDSADSTISAYQFAPIRTFVEADPSRAPAVAPVYSLMHPVQVAPSPGAVYVADIALRLILRVDVGQMSARRMFAFNETAAGLFADRFQTLYVALSSSRRVVQISPSGLVTELLHDPVGRIVPTDVAVDDRGRIFVADAANARVLMLNRIGQVIGSIGERGDTPNPFSSIDGLWVSDGALYVLDATARRVKRFRVDEAVQEEFDLGEWTALPTAVVADRWRRVFVADRASGRIVVFRGGGGDEPVVLDGMPHVQDLVDLSLDDSGMLYVVDGGAATIFRLRVAEPCL